MTVSYPADAKAVPLATPDSISETKVVSPSDTESGYSTPKRRESVLPLAERKSAYVNKGKGPILSSLIDFCRLRTTQEEKDALNDIATQPSVFDGPHAEFYQPRDDWENIEAFDPSFRWTWKEEKKALRKVDWKVLSWVCVMFLALDIDRGNLASATADNFLDDLNLTQGDYNLGNTLSKLGFLIAELPSQLISKRLGPDRWIPIQVIIFSIISASQFWLSGRTSFLATRFLIAAFQGGFIPDNILYLSYWYSNYDLPIRMAIFYTINPFSDMIVSFLAVGLLKMRGVLGYAGWRWLFLIEGIITLLVGIASFFMMPVAPAKTKTTFRPNGYLTDHEAKIIVNRTLRDEPAKGGMHNRQPLTLKMIWKSIMDYHLWPVYLIGLLFGIPAVPVKQYLQLSFRQLGFSTVKANLLTIPSTALAIVNCVLIAVLSEVVNNRSFVCTLEDLWMLPCFIALEVLPTISPWQYFAIATVLLGFPYVHTVQVSWCSRLSGSVRTRTVSASLYNMVVQASSIIGANVYQASDKPRYRKGNRVLLAIIAVCVGILYPGAYVFYKTVNAKRDKQWNAMTEEERRVYLATTTDEGNKRLDFRFAT